MSARHQPIWFAFCLLAATALLEAQSPQILPQELDTTVEAQNAHASPYRFSAKVNRVVVDVVISDVKGNPVEGLKPEDFKVMQDGVVQPIRFFDAHTAAADSASRHVLDLHLPANTFSNLTPSSPDKPVTILLYDMLDTPEDALPFAHEEMVRFIQNRQDSGQIAIFVLTDHLHMLQGFTDDETRLLQAINLKKATAQSPILRDAPLTEGGSPGLLSLEVQELVSHVKRRNSLTVEAFIEIARFVSALPGRKNLIWLSGSFPGDLFPNRALLEEDRFGEAGLRAARLSLIESRVAVYPVDIRGLRADSQYSAANLQTIPHVGAQPNYFGRGQGFQDIAMDGIAESTGGRAFYNTNGLKEAMDTAMRQGSSYYSLTYAPDERNKDRREHTVKVVLTTSGYHLSYRRRYLAPDNALASPAQPLMLDASMKHGAPNSSQLFFEAGVVAVGAPMPASPDELHAFAKFPQNDSQTDKKTDRKTPASGPRRVQHYDINFAMIGREFEMPELADGQYATDLRFGLAAYAEDSKLLNGVEISLKNSIPAEQFRKIVSDGYHASMLIAVPEEAVSLRMAVRDEIGSRLGTIEVPLPLQAVAAAASKGLD